MLYEVITPGFYEALSAQTVALTDGLTERARAAGIPFTANRVGGMFGLFFTGAESVGSYADVMACDAERFKKFFHGMLDEGVYLASYNFV